MGRMLLAAGAKIDNAIIGQESAFEFLDAQKEPGKAQHSQVLELMKRHSSFNPQAILGVKLED